MELRFNEDGTFKIVQFTDLHVGSRSSEADRKTFARIDAVLEAEKPDCIVITGDLINSWDVESTASLYHDVLSHFDEWNIPFAIVYGNHDSEKNITREELVEIQQQYKNCVAKRGPADIHGVGNYSLKIQAAESEQVKSVLYFLDSRDYAPKEIGGYGWIHQDQVNWFAEEAKQYRGIPSLAFFHIPLPEYRDVWSHGKVMGIKREEICAPKVNSGLFSAIVESGDIMGTFVGHDHDNDFCGELHGVSLCYGRVAGYNTYGDLERGARVILLYEGKREFTSWIQLGEKRISTYKHQ